jgi:transposase InsO family protein
MNEEQKKRIAVFRFGVISDFVNRAQLERREKQRLLEQKSAQSWQIPFSGRTRLTPSTILNWIGRYEQSGGKLESLYPQDRNDQGISRVIDAETAQALVRLRKEMPLRPVTSLIEEMVRRELVSPGVQLKASTVYRLLREQGLMNLRQAAPVDRRRFESELPNDLWQSDIMHGPAVLVEGKKRKTYLIAFLDDMSRLIPHAEFYLSERIDSYLDALRKALRKRGLPRKLYVDNGSALRARLLEEISASLGIALIHSRPYTPQGRGKIERLFRSLRSQFLSACTRETLAELNHALEEWIRNVYHSRPHGSTGQTPLRRFTEQMECIRPAPQDLEDYFRKRALRRVARDRTVSLNNRLYEAPVALMGKRVTVLYHDHDPARVEVRFEGRSYGLLSPVDLKVNCRVRRIRYELTLESTGQTPMKTGKLPFRASGQQEETP